MSVHGLSARRPLLGLPLTQHHRRLRRQLCDERRLWTGEWNDVVFTDESRICLQHHDGWIRVLRHHGDRILNSCVHIVGTLNSWRYISNVLEPVGLLYLQDFEIALFQPDNARPYAVRIFQRFLVNHQIELLPWPARSPDLSPIENMWFMVVQRLTKITHLQLPHQINFGNVGKVSDLLYPNYTSEVSLNQCRCVGQL
ncbi:transposable element Tcb1 transposase [Trichonephila clavipes]|uniref:Transposable element Tcb1 transposase n=1 Tax=Trichonephila clavipes TaxID=2585209 RepID=A0A8X6W9Y3_TRICX|nr:transposable element Tcb1 transposase [Trichonephila clavipes]